MAEQIDHRDVVPFAIALQALPLELPERSAWPLLSARIAQQRARQQRSRRWLTAVATAALLALALLPRGGHLASDNASSAQTTTPATKAQQASASLAALMRESAQLERLLAAANDDGASSASTAALGLQMEDALQHLDSSLDSAGLTDQQRLELWHQRVNLLRQAASLESSRHYYAAEGRSLDVALVSAY